MLKDLLKKSRSIRRFYEEDEVPEEMIRDWVDNARYTPSTANGQTLKFRICTSQKDKEIIFPNLKWAGALPDWDGPEPGERPGAYVLIFDDLSLAKSRPVDTGICAQTIMLSAAEAGYGGCILASVNRPEVMRGLGIDQERYALALVLAIGRPKETVMLVPVGEDGSTKYYRDPDGIHYVPKRGLDEILI